MTEISNPRRPPFPPPPAPVRHGPSTHRARPPPPPPPRRLFLPLLDSVRHGTRSHATCHYKCGNACDAAVPNRTDNPTFESVVQTALSRRSLLTAAGAGAPAGGAGR